MKRTALRGASIALAAIAALACGSAAAQTSGVNVRVVEVRGVVDPLEARYVERALREASAAHEPVLIEIDTPGGLDSSMRSIVKAIQASTVRVTCWVGPSGARAASAGAIILLACPRATMAPGTNVGAAHPVGFSGEVLSEKVTNDAAAYARSLAQARDRNADLAERMVRESVSVTAEEALRSRFIDAVEPSARAAAAFGGALEVQRMTAVEALLHGVVDPNLAFLLFLLGLAGIVFEVLHPGISVPGILGSLAFLVSLVILGMLPVNVAGLLLLVAAVGFFVLEAHVPGFGVPAALGFGSTILGGLFLFDSSIPSAHVSLSVVIACGVAVGLFFATIARSVIKARRMPKAPRSTDEMIGGEAVVTTALDPVGIVRARRDSWTARSARGDAIAEGTRVRVERVEGLTLVVDPVHEMQIKGGAS